MTQIFTGIKDIDFQILNNLDDYDLKNVCIIDRYSRDLCKDDQFWKRRGVEKYGQFFLNKQRKTYRQWYYSIPTNANFFYELSKLNRAGIEILFENPIVSLAMLDLYQNPYIILTLNSLSNAYNLERWLKRENWFPRYESNDNFFTFQTRDLTRLSKLLKKLQLYKIAIKSIQLVLPHSKKEQELLDKLKKKGKLEFTTSEKDDQKLIIELFPKKKDEKQVENVLKVKTNSNLFAMYINNILRMNNQPNVMIEEYPFFAFQVNLRFTEFIIKELQHKYNLREE